MKVVERRRSEERRVRQAVLMSAPDRSKRCPIRERARISRHALEQLLDAIGSPSKEIALSHVIDRLLQIEEQDDGHQ